MPKQTFFNLSKEKQARLVVVAEEEFSNNNLRDASIANIVKHADIARGSFYQYFDGIEDLYYYVLRLHQEKFRSKREEIFSDHNLEFYPAMVKFGNYYIQYILESDNRLYFKSVFLNMNWESRQTMRQEAFKACHDQLQMDDLKRKTKQEKDELLKFVLGTLNQSVAESFAKDLTVEQGQANFQKRLKWILYGALN